RRDAGRLLELAEEKSGRAVHRFRRNPAAREVRHHQPADEAAIEELADALWRLEEVERVLRRRRVEDDQVIGAALDEHAELLDRHVLVRAREALREIQIKSIAEDALA